MRYEIELDLPDGFVGVEVRPVVRGETCLQEGEWGKWSWSERSLGLYLVAIPAPVPAPIRDELDKRLNEVLYESNVGDVQRHQRAIEALRETIAKVTR